MGTYLLQGWTMLNENCPHGCNVCLYFSFISLITPYYNSFISLFVNSFFPSRFPCSVIDLVVSSAPIVKRISMNRMKRPLIQYKLCAVSNSLSYRRMSKWMKIWTWITPARDPIKYISSSSLVDPIEQHALGTCFRRDLSRTHQFYW